MGTTSSAVQDYTKSLCGHLRRIGAKANVTKDGPSIERLSRLGVESHGFIELHGSPIRWANVVLWVNVAPNPDYLYYRPQGISAMYVRYGVPDMHLGQRMKKLNISLARVRSFPVFGEVTGLRWKGNDRHSGLLARLNDDIQARTTMMARIGPRAVTPDSPNPAWVTAKPQQSFWLISTPYPTDDLYPLSRDSWHAYESIALHLLATSH